jgi:hypothetical protein
VAHRGFTALVGVDDAREVEPPDSRVDGEFSVGPYPFRATDLGARSGAVRAPHQGGASAMSADVLLWFESPRRL